MNYPLEGPKSSSNLGELRVKREGRFQNGTILVNLTLLAFFFLKRLKNSLRLQQRASLFLHNKKIEKRPFPLQHRFKIKTKSSRSAPAAPMRTLNRRGNGFRHS
jgi:hypothetical protein